LRVAQILAVSEAEQAALEELRRKSEASGRLSLRLRIVELASLGNSNKEIAKTLRVSPRTVARWRVRYLERGLTGIAQDATRTGRPRLISEEQVGMILSRTRSAKTSRPYSARMLARIAGTSEATVRRVLKRSASSEIRF
jgi:transposase